MRFFLINIKGGENIKYGTSSLKFIMMMLIIFTLISSITLVSANEVDVDDINDISHDLQLNEDLTEDSLILETQETVLGATPSGDPDFTDVETKINSGTTVYLENKTYVNNQHDSITVDKTINIYGGSSAKDGKYSTLDAESFSSILNIPGTGKNVAITLNNIIFINGNNNNGGAITISGQAQVTFNNCIFINNDATGNGGAVYAGSSKTITFSNCQFIDNHADGNGGAIYSNGTVTMTNCNFTNNSADNGGAIYSTGSVTPKSCNFDNNHATNNGGGLYFVTSFVSSWKNLNTKFSNNSADNAGGGMYWVYNGTGKNIIAHDFDFSNNSAVYGGGLYLSFPNVKGSKSSEMRAVNFIDNNATYGGGLYINNTISFDEIHMYYFFNNHAIEDGGALYFSDSVGSVKFHSCGYKVPVFVNNSAGNRGGCMYTAAGTVIFEGDNEKAWFSNNTAQNGGSAIYNTGENFTLHGRFDHNLPWIHSINISEGYDIPYGDIENFTIWWHEGDNVIPGVYSTVGPISGSADVYNESSGSFTVTSKFYLNSPDYYRILCNITGDNGYSTIQYMYLDKNNIHVLYENTSSLLNLPIGNYTITAIHSSNGTVLAGPVNTTFTVYGFADLSINKTVSNVTPQYGDTITYTITVTNNGILDATNVKVEDLLDPKLVYVSSSPSAGTYDKNNGIWNIGNLANGNTATLVITVRVNSIGSIENNANVTSDQRDNDTNNAKTNVTINASKVLTYVNATDVSGKPGETVTIDIAVVDKDGNHITEGNVTVELPDGTNVTVSVVNGVANADWNIPNGFTINNYTVNVTYNGNEYFESSTNKSKAEVLPLNTSINGTNAVGKPGETVTIDITVIDENGNSVNNGTVTVELPDGTSKNITVVDGSASVNWTIPDSYPAGTDLFVHLYYNGNDYYNKSYNSSKVHVVGLITDLWITKEVNNQNPALNDEIIFTIKVGNDGPDNATGVNVSELIKALKIVNVNCSQGYYDQSVGLWSVGSLANGSTATLTIVVRVNATGNFENNVNITGDQMDNDTNNSKANETVVVNATSDLWVSKNVSNVNPAYGDVITYTIVVGNDGPDNATGVNVTEVLPDGLVYVSDDSSGAYNPSTGVWAVGNLANGSNVTLVITVRVNVTGNIINVVNVTGDQDDNDTNNSKTNATIESNKALTYVNGTDVSGKPGENVKVVITVVDENGNLVRDGNVTVVLPDNTTETVTIVNGSASVNWTVPEDFHAGNYSVDLTYKGNDDYNPSVNTSNAEVIPLDTVVSAGNVSGKPGETVTVDVSVVDENGNLVRDGNVTVVLPDNTTETVTIVNGSASVNWTVPEDYVGDYTVDVTYNGNDVYNPSSGNGAITVIPIIDLEINISVDRNVVNYGDVVEFIITVRNNGPSDASEVTATNVIPNGFVYLADNCSDANYQTIKSDLLGSSASSQSYDSSGDVWFIGDLAKGEEVKLSILARVNYVGNKSVSTSVIAYENESTYVNNNDSVSVTVMPIVDLELVKTVDKTKVIKGNKVTYTFTVTNRGPNDATGVKVTDSLITKHQFVSASSDGYDYETGIWNIGDLANGSSVTLTVTVIISEPGDYSNSASVSSDQEDTNESNNYASSDNVTASDVPDNETEDEPEVPDEPKKVVSTLPEAGNPILMVLLALFFALLPLKRRR